MHIGSKIKKSRTEAKITQEQVAEALGTSRQTISNWENEKSYPDIASVLKMSDLYGVSLDFLLKGEVAIKVDIDFILSSDMVIQYDSVMEFFCGKYYRSTGRRVSMARSSANNDCSISFDWKK